MRKFLLAAVLVLVAGGAQATLIDRGDGFIYDTVQDITWTQDANISGYDTWDNLTLFQKTGHPLSYAAQALVA